MIQEHFHQEAISFLNVYVLNNRASVHMEKKKKKKKPIQLPGGIDKFKTIVGNFNICCSKSDRINRQKIGKDREDLNNNINRLDLIDIYKILNPTVEYTLCSNIHGIFTKINPYLGSRNKFQ